MTDRIPGNPGRVKLTPVSGQANTYDMEMADNPVQSGTPLNKANLLTDATAALLGLTGNDATVNKALEFSAKFNAHWWWRRTVTRVPTATPLGTQKTVANNAAHTVSYSSALAIDAQGNISLANPQNIVITPPEGEPLANLAPCYIKGIYNDATNIYFIPQGATWGSSNASSLFSNSARYVYISAACAENIRTKQVTGYSTAYGEWEWVWSADRSAYPDSGESGGYEYKYRGSPMANEALRADVDDTLDVIAIGERACTSTPSYQIALPREPEFVLVFMSALAYRTGSAATYIWQAPFVAVPGKSGNGFMIFYQTNSNPRWEVSAINCTYADGLLTVDGSANWSAHQFSQTSVSATNSGGTVCNYADTSPGKAYYIAFGRREA